VTIEARTALAGMLAEWLTGGSVVVANGSESASAPTAIAVDGVTVVATAVFDETTANFHWQRRELRGNDGVLVDALEQDFGTKAIGAVWTLEVPLEVAE
jgi:hypothetical protein